MLFIRFDTRSVFGIVMADYKETRITIRGEVPWLVNSTGVLIVIIIIFNLNIPNSQ